jgi:hypothetical protein
MSGPFAEDARLYMRTAADTALWPLRLWADHGVAMVECAECNNGEVLAATR